VMKRPLPTNIEVQDVMDQVLAEAATAGRKARITAVERRLGIPHATFYRNFADLIPQFRQQTTDAQHGVAASPDAERSGPEDDARHLRRLRRENEDLRRLAQIYSEAIRQLTIQNRELQDLLHRQESVTVLSQRQVSKRTTDRNKDPS
jgi:hypothetical protein